MVNKIFKYSLGFILLGIILAAFCLSPIALFIVSVLFIILAMAEYRDMFKSKGICPHYIIPELAGSISAWIFIFNRDLDQPVIGPVIVISSILSFALTIIRNKKPYIETSLSTIAAIIFILCGLYIIKLTYFFNETFIFVFFAAILFGDFAASVIGPKYQKFKLSAEISPNKTLLGALTHLLSCCLICLTLIHDYPLILCILFGCVISVFSQIGDLTISSIKRELGLKHSGNMFLDYGGIWDRIDAFIFSAPALYYFYCSVLLVLISDLTN